MSNAAFHSIAEMDKAVWAVWTLDIRIVIDALQELRRLETAAIKSAVEARGDPMVCRSARAGLDASRACWDGLD